MHHCGMQVVRCAHLFECASLVFAFRKEKTNFNENIVLQLNVHKKPILFKFMA